MDKLFRPIDNAPLIVFRIFFGFLLFAETFGAILTGWVKRVMIDPVFTFSHIGLEWLQPLPGNGMYYYFGLMSVFGLLVMIGYKYRLSLAAFTIMWGVAYLMQKETYNNHYYLLLLMCIIMLPYTSHQNDKTGNCTDDQSVNDDLNDSPKCLSDWMVGFCGGMGNG